MPPFRLLAEPHVLVPLAVLVVVALARMARLRPRLHPLVRPAAAAALGIVAVSVAGDEVRQAAWSPLVYLLPLLVLFVRAWVLLAEGVIRRRQGVEPPALLGSVLSVLFYGVGGGTLARLWFGLDLTPFLATSAVVGAVVALALQETLGNLFAGIALHTEAPFRVGDWVRVGDHDGRVEQISWRAIRLRTWEGDALTVPNGDVARRTVLNYAMPRGPHLRRLALGASYQTPPNRVLAVLRDVLSEVEGLPAEPPPVVRVAGFADSSILYEVHYPYRSFEDWRRLEGEIHRLIWYHFRRHAIEIPFPIRNVFLHRVRGGVESDSPAARLARTLRQIDLFRALSDEEIHMAALRFHAQHYAAGERIIGEGTAGDTFFVVDRGEVEVSRGNRTLARLPAGHFFGEMALLTGEARSATVVAATDVDVFTLDRAGFHDVLAGNPAIAEEISAILAERREAHAANETDTSHPEGEARGEVRRRILKGIRDWFGL